MFSSSVRIPSVEEGEMTCELPWAHVELPGAHEQGAVHARASASGKPSEKHATGADTLDMSLSPPCAAPHVGQNSTGDTEVGSTPDNEDHLSDPPPHRKLRWKA